MLLWREYIKANAKYLAAEKLIIFLISTGVIRHATIDVKNGGQVYGLSGGSERCAILRFPDSNSPTIRVSGKGQRIATHLDPKFEGLALCGASALKVAEIVR